MQKHGSIAFITTPEYRANHPEKVEEFVFRHLYPLCNWFEVRATGRTYSSVMEIVARPINKVDAPLIGMSAKFPVVNEGDLLRWRRTIEQGLTPARPSIQGIIELAYELVEGRLDAIIYLTDWTDVAEISNGAVLRREANVHNVPIASDIDTAAAAMATWSGLIAKAPAAASIFPSRNHVEESPLNGLTVDDKVLVLIAHDRMKLEMCCFVVENDQKIFGEFDYILTTGTTGEWIKRFAVATGRSPREVEKIKCCLPGPYGGDIQIAAAVVKRLCRKVIFLQDPFTSHAHETDIRLFEQAALLLEKAAPNGSKIEIATNVASAKAILGLQ
jgi:methylglyoxal synthase